MQGKTSQNLSISWKIQYIFQSNLSNNFDVQTFFASRWEDRHFDWDSLVEDVQCRNEFCNVAGTIFFASVPVNILDILAISQCNKWALSKISFGRFLSELYIYIYIYGFTVMQVSTTI